MKKFLLVIASLFIACVVNAQQIVQLSNTKITTSASTKVVIKGGITFSGTNSLKDSGIIYILENPDAGRENWTDNTSTGVFHADSRGTVIFNSPNQHQITGPGNFYTATVRSDSGLNFLSNANVRNVFNLDTGMVYVATGNSILIDNPAVNAIQSSSNYSKSYISGKLIRMAAVSDGEYFFPVGKITTADSFYAPVKLKKVNSNLADYEVEYFKQTPVDNNNMFNPPVKDVSDVEYWTITSKGEGDDDDATITLSWRDISNVNSLAQQRDSLLVLHYADYGGVKWITENNYSMLNTVTGTASFGYVTNNIPNTDIGVGYPYYTLGGQTPLVILPVRLINFSGNKESNYSKLKWQVANNEMAAYYELQQASASQQFSTIYKTAPTAKQGDEFYSTNHLQPAAGDNYYRLKITEVNGKISYSNIVRLQFSQETKYKLYPNPADKFVNIQLMPGQASVIRIFDNNGKLVAQKNTSSMLLQVDISALKQGIYYAQITANGESTTLPFIKR